MAYKINPDTGERDYYQISDLTQAQADLLYLLLDQTTPQTIINGAPNFSKGIIHGILASAPTSPTEGCMYVNSGDDTLYIYYGGTWQALHVLTPAALSFLLLEDGTTLLLETGDKLALEA
jgi:hypothetical protein